MNKRKPVKKSTTEQFEEARLQGDRRTFVLRLFVTGITPRSLEAIGVVRRLYLALKAEFVHICMRHRT
jgi:hypothetical protein